MKLARNVCLDEISDELENGSCRIKNQVTRSNLKKPCVSSRGHIFGPILMKLGQNVCLMKSLLFNAISHNPQGSGERLKGHHCPLVLFSISLKQEDVC